MWLGGAFALILSFVLASAARFLLVDMGGMTKVASHGTKPCAFVRTGENASEPVELWGPEDVAVSRSGIAFISSDDRRWIPEGAAAFGRDGADFAGGIFVMDLHAEGDVPTMLPVALGPGVSPEHAPDFHPHGIGLLELSAREWELYIVVHDRLNDSVWICDVELGAGSARPVPVRLKVKAVVRSALFTGINDVAPVDPGPIKGLTEAAPVTRARGFFVSNFHHSPPGTLWQFVEMVSQRPWSDVVFCSLDIQTSAWRCRHAIPDSAGPNGVALSPDQRRLYVAQSLPHTLSAYPLKLFLGPHGISQELGTPLRTSAPFGIAALDNIDVDRATGDLYLAVHPVPLAFLSHSRDHSRDAPSKVFRVRYPKGELAEPEVKEVLADSGTRLSASSIAAYYRDGKDDVLVVGGVFRPGVLVCRYAGGLP